MNKTPTIDDLAVALGMHKSTVSKALSGKGNISSRTRARVRSAASEIGYEPNPVAQRLANGYRNPIVTLLAGTIDLGLATQKIRLIQRALADGALEVPIHTCPEPKDADGGWAQAAQVRQLCRQRPRAIVCAVQMLAPEVFPELDAYQRAGGLVVAYDTPAALNCDQVLFDREENAYQSARYLVERGHRRIGFGLSRTPPWLDGVPRTPQVARLRGFRRALEESGVPVRDEWLFENGSYEEGGEEMARRFLALPPDDRPTAVCIVNDYVAFAFQMAITRAGVRVPEELSIISHDDQPIASRCPIPLTAVSHPADRIAQEVSRMVLERIAGYDGPPRTVTVHGELIERESVAAAP